MTLLELQLTICLGNPNESGFKILYPLSQLNYAVVTPKSRLIYNCKTLNLIHYKCTYKNIYVYEYMLHITGETQLSLLLSTIVSHKAQPETLFKDKIWNFIEHVIDNHGKDVQTSL